MSSGMIWCGSTLTALFWTDVPDPLRVPVMHILDQHCQEDMVDPKLRSSFAHTCLGMRSCCERYVGHDAGCPQRMCDCHVTWQRSPEQPQQECTDQVDNINFLGYWGEHMRLHGVRHVVQACKQACVPLVAFEGERSLESCAIVLVHPGPL
jgi:hypothetical protein